MILPEEAQEALRVIPQKILSDYRKAVRQKCPDWKARNRVYDHLRALPDFWEARNTRPVKLVLDAINQEVAGRDTSADWRLRP